MKKISTLAIMATFLSFGIVPPVHAAADIGDLIKCEDFSSVYFLAEDGNRYAFPNEKMYFSWYQDFDDVKEISCDDLGDLTLAGNVVYQAGTRLIKIQSSPTVYVVEYDGVVRPLSSEEQAKSLYGDGWADRVDDVPDAFFSSFEVGEDLPENEFPAGMILEDDDGNLLRVEADQTATEIEDILETDDDEIIFNSFARSASEVGLKLGIDIAISKLTDLDMDALASVIELLKTINVDSEFEFEIEIKEKDEADWEEAHEEIEEAKEEIERAQEKISKREEKGKDVTEANTLLAEAEDLLALAQTAYNAGDYDTAEDLIDQSQDKAKDARMGSAVNSIDSDDDADAKDEEEKDEEDVEDDEENEDDV